MSDIDSIHSFSDQSDHSDGNGKPDELYFDVSSPKKTRPIQKSDSSGALELLMSAPKSPRSIPTGRQGRQSRRDLQGSSWDKLRRRMSKSPARISSRRLVIASPRQTKGEDLATSSDHVVNSSDNRRTIRGSMAINMSGRTKNRSGRAIVGSRADARDGSESFPQSLPSPCHSVDSKLYIRPQKSPRSPRTRKKSKEKYSEDSTLAAEKPLGRVRRKGHKKNEFMTPNPRSKPMVEMEDLARLTDVYNDVIVKTKRGSRRATHKKVTDSEVPADEDSIPDERKSIDADTDTQLGSRESIDTADFQSEGKKSTDEDDIISGEEPKLPFALPFDLPFDDDDAATTTSGKSRGRRSGKRSKRGKTSKSPGRLARKTSTVDISGFEDDIENLQNEVLRLKESKFSGDSETSKHMQELRRKAFDARLDLQKSQLENRQVRSNLRDKTTALNEAELDILDLEKRLEEKVAQVEGLHEKVKDADSRSDDNKTVTSNDNNNHKESSSNVANSNRHDAMVDRYETTINRKDTKLASLERELRRLRKSGGSVMSSRGSEEVTGKAVEGLQNALKDTQAQNNVLNKRYNGQKDRNGILEEEILHWKSQTYNMEDEIAEVRSQLNYWMAKYEDVVGASDSAKAQLTGKSGMTRACSINDLNDVLNNDKLKGSYRSDAGSFDMDAGSFDLDAEAHIRRQWEG